MGRAEVERILQSSVSWRRRRIPLALAVFVVPFLYITFVYATENIHPPWGFELNSFGTTIAKFQNRADREKLVHIGQFRADNQVVLWQAGLNEVVSIIQGGQSNFVLAVQKGSSQQAFIGQFGNENSAVTWQNAEAATAIVSVQLGDRHAVSVWPGAGLAVSIFQLSK